MSEHDKHKYRETFGGKCAFINSANQSCNKDESARTALAAKPIPHDFIFCNSSNGLCECGEPRGAEIHCANKECTHNQLQRSKERYAKNVYVCGRCSSLFIVAPKPTDSPVGQREPMFDNRPPWGKRARQA